MKSVMNQHTEFIRFKQATIMLIVVLLLFSAASCGKQGLVGTWKSQDGYVSAFYTFNSDGTGVYRGEGFYYPFTYKTNANKLSLSIPEISDTPIEVQYSINADILSFTVASGTTTWKRY